MPMEQTYSSAEGAWRCMKRWTLMSSNTGMAFAIGTSSPGMRRCDPSISTTDRSATDTKFPGMRRSTR